MGGRFAFPLQALRASESGLPAHQHRNLSEFSFHTTPTISDSKASIWAAASPSRSRRSAPPSPACPPINTSTFPNSAFIRRPPLQIAKLRYGRPLRLPAPGAPRLRVRLARPSTPQPFRIQLSYDAHHFR